jgi:hypothetical protein
MPTDIWIIPPAKLKTIELRLLRLLDEFCYMLAGASGSASSFGNGVIHDT